MRNLKRLATSLVALVLVIAFSSCEKQPSGEALQEVTFNINNVTDLLKKSTTPDNTSGLPTCMDLPAAYAMVTLSGGELDGSQSFKLNILTGLNDGTETQVMKLPIGDYLVDGFEVYADGDVLIWATPEACSHYANLWTLVGVTSTSTVSSCDKPSLGFTVDAFKKKVLDVDVLCWEEYSYDEFGFNWFRFHEITVKTICFFGDVCTPNYVEWNQDQMDFVANIKVDIYDGTTLVGTGSSSYDDNKVMGPVCVEFPDYADKDDEKYTVEIYVLDTLIKTLTLNASDGTLWDGSNEIRYMDTNDNDDTDGIVDFVYYEGQDCNYMGNAGVNFMQQFVGGYYPTN